MIAEMVTLSFWEELLHRVHVDESMTMLEAHQRDNLYGFYKATSCTENCARGRALMYSSDELPPVIFTTVGDTESDRIRDGIKAMVERGELHPLKAAQRYYDAIMSRVEATA